VRLDDEPERRGELSSACEFDRVRFCARIVQESRVDPDRVCDRVHSPFFARSNVVGVEVANVLSRDLVRRQDR
jgi:hypothetical protein